ncbi:Aldo-keto reductase family 4 member C8 [Orchesella cincta]|uniref:Aldo-keto reductase family 4 member C8 n=1 Tax=Orchesella cincta TaxID=48709 RepID=A0A1D2NC39_ORCCI|nr:Aldo-keto reductase family 4 member C8 [Orchesella cincta]
MPKLIYGTAWKKERTADLVTQAIRAGFRGVDTACQPKHYHEPGVGAALKVLEAEDGIKREDLFIQTKFTSIDGQDPKTIPYDPRAELQTTVKQSLEVSLRNLGTSYIDSLVIHSPMRTHRDTMEVWRVFESFVDEGKVKQLGISNCYKLNEFQSIFNEARIKPAVLQNRFYAETDFDKGLREFCKENGIFYQSFWTLTANPRVLSSSRVREIAQKYGKTTPQVFFAYLIQTGVITPLTGTTNVQHMKEDLQTLDMKLTEDEMGVFDSFFN